MESPRDSIFHIDRSEGDFILCNKQQVSQYKEFNHERRSQFAATVDNQIERTKNNRHLLEAQQRHEQIHNLKKWDNYRQAKHFVKKRYDCVFKVRRKTKEWIKLKICAKALRKILNNMAFTKVQNERQRVEDLMAKLLQTRWLSKIGDRSLVIADRYKAEMRFQALIKGNLAHNCLYESRSRLVVLWILKIKLDCKKFYIMMFQHMLGIITIQRKIKEHTELMMGRRQIMLHFWTEYAIKEQHTNDCKDNTKEHTERLEYCEKVSVIPDRVRDAIIEKWLTYAKSQNLTEFIVWRLHIMQRAMSMRE